MAKAMHKIRLKRYEVKTIIEDDCPMFFGDPVLLERVVANLVDNAAKYCPAGSIIQFHAWGDEEHVSISIEDNGPGLPKDIDDELFPIDHELDTSAQDLDAKDQASDLSKVQTPQTV